MPRARGNFSRALRTPEITRVQIECFDKDSNAERAAELLQPLLTGRSAGVLSEAVVPRWPIRARCWSPLRIVCASASCRTSRPSAILLALDGVRLQWPALRISWVFAVPKDECRRAIVARERESREQDITQVLYRKRRIATINCCRLLQVCSAKSRLCVASDLTRQAKSVRQRNHCRMDGRQSGNRPPAQRISCFTRADQRNCAPPVR